MRLVWSRLSGRLIKGADAVYDLRANGGSYRTCFVVYMYAIGAFGRGLDRFMMAGCD